MNIKDTNLHDWVVKNLFEIQITLFIVFMIINIFFYFFNNGSVELQQIEDLFASMILSVFILFFIMCTPQYTKIVNGEGSIVEKSWLIVLFGFMSIFGTMFGCAVHGAVLNFRDLGPLIAGLIGGPVIGVAVGLIGGSFRMMLGSDTAIPCFIATVMAGLIGGLMKKRLTKPRWYHYALLALVVESIHILVILPLYACFTSYNMQDAMDIIGYMYAPMCFFTIIGLLAFFALTGIVKDRNALKKSENDLNSARVIQLTTVPQTYPKRKEFDIRATMEPAIEVGGDFYDFFFIDKYHFVVIMADVSDKGMPAAMFMMKAKAVIKAVAESGKGVGEIFTEANRELSENNGADMFLTVWMGVLNINTGRLEYVNAGHTAPYIKRSGGRFEKITMKPGLVMAYSNKMKYVSEELYLGANDELFLYTDGVTEAMNENNDLYGAERLSEALNSASGSPDEVIAAIRESVRSFTGDAVQSDDITMLAVKLAPGFSRSITLPAVSEELPNAVGFVESMLEEFECSRNLILKIDIVVEEIFVNIVDYAYRDQVGDATIYCSVIDDEITLTFIDRGVPFNPLEHKDPDVNRSVEEWPIGGLGILMSKKLMSHCDYSNIDGENILVMKRSIGDKNVAE